jgi:hypothetical protein
MSTWDDEVVIESSRRARWWAVVRKQPSAVLLLVQILGILTFPFLGGSTGRVIIAVFGVGVLTLALVTVRSTPALTWLSFLIGRPGSALEIYGVFAQAELALVVGHILLAIFYFYTGYGLIAYIFEDNFVQIDELFAVGAAFTVLAWGFTYIYAAVQIVYPGSFGSSTGEEVLSWQELLFCSVANFTGVGLSDVTPLLPHAQSVVMVEQIGGVLYIAMVISRIVALTVVRARS